MNVPGRKSVDQLKGREKQIYEMIGQGLTTKQMADHLDRSKKTVEALQAKLRDRLGLINAHALRIHAIENRIIHALVGGGEVG